MGMIVIVDYGAGNLMSVTNALKYIGVKSVITSEPKTLEMADGIILPGVGAFPSAMHLLKNSGLCDVIIDSAQKKPLLGICLGMQMLFEYSEEIERCDGLGLIKGGITRIETNLKLPHIGWNSLIYKNKCVITENVPEGSYVYFVHSFCAQPQNANNVVAISDYGTDIAAIVCSDNIFGCQFHPEKSGEPGLEMLRNFCKLTR